MAINMRKFEQNAIVNLIIKSIEKNLQLKQREVESGKDFKELTKMSWQLTQINKQRDKLNDDMQIIRDSIVKKVTTFNDKHGTCYRSNSYYGDISFEFDECLYRSSVEDYLACELLNSDSKVDLHEIIQSIAFEFTNKPTDD
tara:strand:- start:1453 stop:1878 length:426 start_codon:yes stop_codon:yes gene_type:complete